MIRFSEVRKKLAYYFTEPAVRILAKTPITPNTLSWFGFIVTIGAAILIVGDHLLVAGLVVLLAGFFDMLDGALARHTSRITRFGGALDSVLDRLSEAVLLLGILVWHLYSESQSATLILLVFLALLFSSLVSYLRARAEVMGIDCQLGLFTRPERVIVLAGGLLLNQLVIALAVIAVLSLLTAGQRLFYIWQQTRNG